ncbi:MAG TPA: imidazole glycerol phosphate synthase subunit HisH [Acidimicrobiia bacterium]|nr:imidazole glycerol phosphate synthase subunit HisH [Acidimicrobiia bacterium]
MIAVVDYGIGNLRSAQKALIHLGADAVLTSDPDTVRSAGAVVLPGVGAFGACMRALRDAGLEEPVVEAAGDGRPFLGVCVGMQMLFDESEESPDVAGLGIVPGAVRRIETALPLPHMGWNTLDIRKDDGLLAGFDEPPWLYFVHTFAAVPEDDGVVAATTDYDGPVVAVVEQANVWATQFHPEKSSDTGLAVLRNFVAAVGAS